MRLLYIFTFLCLLLAHTTVGKADLSPAMQSDIEKTIKTYLLDNPDVILEALKKLEDKAKVQSKQRISQVLKKENKRIFDKNAPFLGNKNGKVEIVEFFDYRCGYCRKMTALMQKILSNNSEVKLILQDLPVLGPDSRLISKYALAANKQGKGDVFHLAMMAHRGGVNASIIENIAGKNGLDVKRLKADIKDPAIDKKLNAQLQLARQLQIQGTPTMVIGDQVYRGFLHEATMRAIIRQQLDKQS